jgi:hypothetical protein
MLQWTLLMASVWRLLFKPNLCRNESDLYSYLFLNLNSIFKSAFYQRDQHFWTACQFCESGINSRSKFQSIRETIRRSSAYARLPAWLAQMHIHWAHLWGGILRSLLPKTVPRASWERLKDSPFIVGKASSTKPALRVEWGWVCEIVSRATRRVLINSNINSRWNKVAADFRCSCQSAGVTIEVKAYSLPLVLGFYAAVLKVLAYTWA